MQSTPRAGPYLVSSPVRGSMLVLASLFGIASAPHAGFAQVPRDSVRLIEPVVVKGTHAPATVGGAGAVVVLPDALPIPVSAGPTLEQVLRQSPFVLLRQNSRGEVELSVRGSESRQGAVLLDGLPLTIGWDHRTDPSLVPAMGVERVTLVRGLASVVTGPNVVGGVIELDVNARGSISAGGRSPLRIGVDIDHFGARALTAAGKGGTAAGRGVLTLRAGAGFRQRDGFALGRVEGASVDPAGTSGSAAPAAAGDRGLRANSDLRQADAFAAVRLDRPSGAYVGLMTSAYDVRRGVPPELHVEQPRLWRYPNAARQLGILSAGTGLVRTPAGNGELALSLGANAGAVELESFTDPTYTVVAMREQGDELTVSGRVLATHSLPREARLRLAGTFAAVRYDETLETSSEGPSSSRYRQELESLGAEVELPAGSRALVSAGLVRDASSTPSAGGRVPLPRASRLGWRFGSTVAVTDAVQVHASASRRARFASLRELYSGALARFDPNPELRPEQLLGVEAGVTIADGGGRPVRTLQVVTFHHRLDDAVVRVTLPNRLFRRVNRDRILSTGVEVLAGWSSAGASGASVTADLLAQQVRVLDRTVAGTGRGARRAEHQPRLRAGIGGGVPLGILGLRGSAAARHTGTQYCLHPDLGRDVQLGAHTVADLAVSRDWLQSGRFGRVLGALRGTLAVHNVGNAAAYDQCGLPQPGRTLRLGLGTR